MSYVYREERSKLFTEEGQVKFLRVRDAAKELLGIAGAFRCSEMLHKSGIAGDSWFQIACVDRLVELGEIIELNPTAWAQHKIYTSSR